MMSCPLLQRTVVEPLLLQRQLTLRVLRGWRDRAVLVERMLGEVVVPGLPLLLLQLLQGDLGHSPTMVVVGQDVDEEHHPVVAERLALLDAEEGFLVHQEVLRVLLRV